MKKVLVVGAAGGVGSAVASALVGRGDHVFATVLDAPEADMARARVPTLASIDIADLADADATVASVRRIVQASDGLDAVVVCAAISPFAPMETTSLATLRRTLEINAVSAMAIFQAVMPALRKSKGRIVFISSMAGKTGMPMIGAYTASKYALEGLADVMRREVAAQGVHIVLVEPGGIKTGMVEGQLRSIVGEIEKLSGEPRTLYLHLYKQFQILADTSHKTTSSSPEDVAAIVLEALDAAEPQARYIAGADAKALLELAHASTDAELDVVFAGMFPMAAE